MDEEMEAIRKNNTWSLTYHSASRQMLNVKWVNQVKNKVDTTRNNTKRLKARLCYWAADRSRGKTSARRSHR